MAGLTGAAPADPAGSEDPAWWCYGCGYVTDEIESDPFGLAEAVHRREGCHRALVRQDERCEHEWEPPADPELRDSWVRCAKCGVPSSRDEDVGDG